MHDNMRDDTRRSHKTDRTTTLVNVRVRRRRQRRHFYTRSLPQGIVSICQRANTVLQNVALIIECT